MRKLLNLFAAFFICAISFSSCSFLENPEDISASLDGNKDKERGPSGIVSDADLSMNIMTEWMWGLNGPNSPGLTPQMGENSADGREWLPMGYKPVAKEPLQFATGIELVGKNFSLNDYHQHQTYLVVYQDVRYVHMLEDGGKIFAGLGPYIGLGIAGKSGSDNFKVATFGGDDGFKRFDFGLHLTGGYKFPSSLSFRLNYEYGLYDKSPNPDDYTSRNRTWSVAVGYSVDKIIKGFRRKK